MPKDPTRNITHYQIQGGHLNEFEFSQSHGEMTEEERERFERREAERLSREGNDESALQGAPETESERIQQMMEDARAKAEKNLRRKEKQASTSKKSATGGGGAKKKAAGKAATTKTTRKAGAASKRVGAKSGVKGRSAAKAGAKKSGARAASKTARRR